MKFFRALDRVLTPMANRLEQMRDMMHVTGAIEGLETNQMGEAELRSAMFMCSGCRSATECKTWLANADAQEHAPEFCPNASRFEQLATR